MNEAARIIDAMIAYYEGDARRIGHFLKVYGFAKAIGEAERLSGDALRILEAAAITHDIGIKNSELKYNSSAGGYQELEGPPEARKLLEALGIEERIISRVCWLIAHHHTYGDIRGDDHQILVEADFLVNADEDNLPPAAIGSVRRKVFKTRTGLLYLNRLYGV